MNAQDIITRIVALGCLQAAIAAAVAMNFGELAAIINRAEGGKAAFYVPFRTVADVRHALTH